MALLTFENILGQSSAIDVLKSAYTSELFPHAMIFAGPCGVGKATTAAALGALLLCHNPISTKPCGKCESCRVMAAGNHPDFHVVYRQLIRIEKKDAKGRDLPIDVIREFLIRPANLKAALDHGKVFVVEEAELMNIAAQNVLLKTLEEPPPGTVIILLTDQPDLLLPTIRSRCQIIRFAELDEKIVLDELKKNGISPDLAKQAIQFADGSLGLALKWTQDGVIASAAELTQIIESMLSGQRAPALPDFFKRAADAYATCQLKIDEKNSKDQANREGLVIFLKIASQILRKRLTAETDPDRLEQICVAIDSLVRAESYIESNVGIPIVFQQLAMSLDASLV